MTFKRGGGGGHGPPGGKSLKASSTFADDLVMTLPISILNRTFFASSLSPGVNGDPLMEFLKIIGTYFIQEFDFSLQAKSICLSED